MIYGVTYADEKMSRSAELCMRSMKKYAVDDVRGMNATWRKAWEHTDTFDWLNKDILSQSRGCGYWLWKPWAIAYRMNDLKNGDTLIYCDAGCEFVDDVRKVIDCMDQDIMFFTNGFQHVEWCKGDVIQQILHNEYYGSYDYSRYEDCKQVQASLIIFRVNETTRNFVKEWLLYCQMPGFIDDSPSKAENFPTFAEHRHDQAILTCLQIKYGYKLHWFPSTMFMHRQDTRLAGDTYPPILNHHRKRDPGKGDGVNPEW